MKKKPTAENVAEEILREIIRCEDAGEKPPTDELLFHSVSKNFSPKLNDNQMSLGLGHLKKNCAIGKIGDRWTAPKGARDVLSTIAGERTKSRRWALVMLAGLVATAATIWGVYMVL